MMMENCSLTVCKKLYKPLCRENFARRVAEDIGVSFFMSKLTAISLGFFSTLVATSIAEASATGGEEIQHGLGGTLFWIVVILISAKLFGLVEKIGQPGVLGELLAGVVLGNLALFGFSWVELPLHDPLIKGLAQIGVIILLLQAGLESNVKEIMGVGKNAIGVALIGVLLPFIGGYFIGPILMPGLSSNTYLFLGATLTATSVGITARVFKDLKYSASESRIVLGAAVADDILGLVILSVVSAIVTVGVVSVSTVGVIVVKALLFLIGAIFLGQWLAPYFYKAFSRISTSVAMKITLVLAFAFALAYIAEFMGLAPIVGAFAAGLVLDSVHFKYFDSSDVIDDIRKSMSSSGGDDERKMNQVLAKHQDKHIEDLVEPIGYFLIPIFFVLTGMEVNLKTLADSSILVAIVGLTMVAVVGKLLAGLAAGRGNNMLIVGFGMLPRGEVGLIFALVGKSLGVVNDSVYSAVVLVVMLTTLLAPPILTIIISRQKKKLAEAASYVS